MSKFYRVCYALFAGIVRVLFRIRVIGGEKEPVEGGFIVCSNHISAADPVVISAAMRHQVCYMAKIELFRIPLLSWLIRALGAYPIDRKNNDVGAIKRSVAMLGEGKCIGIFPQGTRYPGEDPRQTKLKNGVSLIAVHAEADVLPVYVRCRDNRLRVFRRTEVIVGDPIPFADLAYNREASGEYTRMTGEIFETVCALADVSADCAKDEHV